LVSRELILTGCRGGESRHNQLMMEIDMNTQQAIRQQPIEMNGLDVQAAVDTIEAIKGDRSLARFQFRARNTWINGGINRSVIRDFYGAGREDDSRRSDFVFTNGEPPVLLLATTRVPIQ
jgi:hypothetical protein